MHYLKGIETNSSCYFSSLWAQTLWCITWKELKLNKRFKTSHFNSSCDALPERNWNSTVLHATAVIAQRDALPERNWNTCCKKCSFDNVFCDALPERNWNIILIDLVCFTKSDALPERNWNISNSLINFCAPLPSSWCITWKELKHNSTRILM